MYIQDEEKEKYQKFPKPGSIYMMEKMKQKFC